MAVLTWSPISDITYGTPLDSVQLNAVADTEGSFSYSPSPGIVLPVGQHILVATFTPTGGQATETISNVVNVLQASPVINWTIDSPVMVGTALSASQLGATANVPGEFTYSVSLGTKLPIGEYLITAVFAPEDSIDYSTITLQGTVVVQDQLLSIEVVPLFSTLAVGDSQIVKVLAEYASATNSDITDSVNYTISAPGVTYTNGVITADTPGTYTLTFNFEGLILPLALTVTSPPSSMEGVDSSFYRSHLNQVLLNYFDKSYNRIRENPFTIDAQLLGMVSVAVERLNLRLHRETQVNLNSPCNVDNGGVYYGYVNPQTDLSAINSVTGIVNGTQVTFTAFDDTLPIPVSCTLDPTTSSYSLANPILLTLTGTGMLQNAAIGTLPIPEKLTVELSGSSMYVPNVDIAITGYRYPKPLWLADQELYTEVIDVTEVGTYKSLNVWQEVTNICVRGLGLGYNLNFYGHCFTIPYKADGARPFTSASQRYSKFPRYWNIFGSELIVQNTMSGYEVVQPKLNNIGVVDVAVEPNTWGMYGLTSSGLVYLDRREPMPSNLSAMAIAADPIIGLSVSPNYTTSGPFTNVLVSPMLYPKSSGLFQYRIFFQDPAGNFTVLGPDGSLITYAPNNGWRTVLPTAINVVLPSAGTYTFVIQGQDTMGNVTTDTFLYNNLALSPVNTLALPSEIQSPQGVCFDSYDRLWVWDGATAYPLQLQYNNYIVDVGGGVLYLTQPATGVTVS